MLNNITIQGRVCNKAGIELRKTTTGISTCSFTIAHERDYKSKDGEKTTDFFDVVCWRTNAEFCSKYLESGQIVVVKGTLQAREYEKDGVKKKFFEIVSDKVYPGQKKKSVEQGTDDFAVIEPDSDIPF